MYINCGGLTVEVNDRTYEGDANVDGGAAKFYPNNNRWGLSSTGDYMDDDNFQNVNYNY